MATHKLTSALCFVLFSFSLVSQGVIEAAPTKLFAFGDSYADTGNAKPASSWRVPAGITFPGKPSGRFSDGRVITDYLAMFLGLETPTPYMLRKSAGQELEYGMNFAFGGTGVFKTLFSGPNLTAQIGFLQDVTHEGVYTQQDLKNSMAYVTVSGNDFSAYLNKGGSIKDLPKFSARLINQLAVNLKSIGDMGVGKVAVASLEPLGCLPILTVFRSFKQCNKILNKAVTQHNVFLQKAVAKLNKETKGSPFVILDAYNAFLTSLQNKGSTKFQTPLKPCCMGLNVSNYCGDVDKTGKKLYTICSNPGTAFFWDIVHPTQAGWYSVFVLLKPTLRNLVS